MRKLAIICAGIICCIIILFAIWIYEPTPIPAIANHVTVDIGESKKFTESEIQDAMNMVFLKFQDFGGCTLTRLWYDESASDSFFRNSDNANRMMLLCDFSTDHNPGDGLNRDFDYTRWTWTLKREDSQNQWTIKDWGYG